MSANAWALLCASILPLSAVAVARQAVDDGVLSIHLTVEDADQITGTLPPQYRVYVEPESVRLSLSLGNESEEPIVVDQRRLESLLRLRVETADSRVVPVSIAFLPEIRLQGEWITAANSWDSMTIEPHTGVSWIVSLTRGGGGVFNTGNYAVTYEVPNLQSIVRKLSGNQWIGRTPSRPATVPFVIALPQTPREMSAVHKMAARNAMLRRDRNEEAAEYSRALAADPTDTMAVSGLANSLLGLRRYKEAVPLYERLIKEGARSTETHLFAAEAYMGLADEANARRVLGAAGFSPERIQKTVARLRARGRP